MRSNLSLPAASFHSVDIRVNCFLSWSGPFRITLSEAWILRLGDVLVTTGWLADRPMQFISNSTAIWVFFQSSETMGNCYWSIEGIGSPCGDAVVGSQCFYVQRNLGNSAFHLNSSVWIVANLWWGEIAIDGKVILLEQVQRNCQYRVRGVSAKFQEYLNGEGISHMTRAKAHNGESLS